MWNFSRGAVLVFGVAMLAILLASVVIARRDTLAELRQLFDPRVIRRVLKPRSRRWIVGLAVTLISLMSCLIFFLNPYSIRWLYVFVFFPGLMVLLARIAYLSMFDDGKHRKLPDKIDDRFGES